MVVSTRRRRVRGGVPSLTMATRESERVRGNSVELDLVKERRERMRRRESFIVEGLGFKGERGEVFVYSVGSLRRLWRELGFCWS